MGAGSAQAWWTVLGNRGAPVASYYLGDDLAYVFNFAVNQDTSPMTVSYGVGTTTGGSGWTWRAAEWSHQSGGDRYWKSKANEHRFTSTGNWYYSGRFVWTSGGYTEYASGDWAENRTTLSAASYFTVNALNNPSSQSATTASGTQINLGWTRGTSGTAKNTVIFRSTSSTAPTPAGGTAYSAGNNYTLGGISYRCIYNGSGTSTSDTGLSNGTTYYYYFFAENNSYYSSGVNANATTWSAPSAPTITGITPGNGQLSVAFTAPASDGGSAISNYKYSTNNGSTWTTRSPAATGSPIVITGLNNGTEYTVRIRAVNAVGDGTQSGSSTGTPRTTPTLAATPTSASVETTTATLGGNATATGGASITERGIYWSTVNNFTPPGQGTKDSQTGTFGTGSFTRDVTGLPSGSTVYFRSFAVNAAGTVYSGNQGSILTKPAAPSTPTSSSVGETGFTANWSGVTGAASYRLDVATDSGFSSILGSYNNLTVSGTSQAISGLTPGRTYYVRVRAVNATGTSGNSGTLTQATDCWATGPTVGAASGISDDRFTANWSAVSGATGYRLDVSTSATFSGGAPGDHIDENIQDWTNRGSYGTYAQTIDAGTVNMVQCIVQNGASANGVCSVGRVQMQGSNGILELPSLNTVGTISMNIVAGGAGRTVKLQRYVSGSWTDLTTWSGIGTTGATYTYDLNSSDSGIQLRLASPSAALYVHDIHVAANGSSSAFVDGYEDLDVGNVTSYQVTGLDDDTTYYYRVRAVNDDCTSPNSGTQSATTLIGLATEPTTQAHTLTFSSLGSGSFTINWTSGNGANRLVAIDAHDFSDPPADGTTYSANTSLGGGDELDDGGWVVYAGSGSSVAVTGLSPQTLYYVKIYEFNGSGGTENYLTSSASGNPASRFSLSTEPSAHGTLTATAASASSIDLSWTAATGAGGYVIVRKAGSAPTTAIPVDGAAAYSVGNTIGDGTVVYVGTSGGAGSTTDSHGSMSAGTAYHYKIYPYAYNGTPANQTYNYKTDGTPGADSATTWTTPTVTTATPADPSTPSDPTQATAGGEVTATGGATVSERGIVWGTSANPTTSNNKVAHASGGTGSYTVTLTGLTPGQTIHYRAYAINAVDTAYGSSETFAADCFQAGPTIGAASSVSASGFTANWSALTGATGYRLDVSENPSFDNRVANADFASGDATGWSLQTQLSVSDEDAYSGTHSVKASAVTATRSVSQTVSIPVADGSTAYEISYWYRFVVDTGNGIRIWSSWDNGGGSGDSLTPGSYNAKESEWTQIVLVNTPAAGATSLNFEVRVYNGATAFLDGFSVRKVGGDSSRFLAGFSDKTVSGTSEPVSGLDPNATYYYRVRGVNAFCTTPNSATATAVTWANVPTAPTVTAEAAGSLDVVLNVNGNPAHTEFAIRVGPTLFVQANGTLGASAVWQTAATWDDIVVTGLDAGTSYSVYVKARNSALVETAFSSAGSATTWDVPALSSPTAASIGQTTATLGATVTGNGGSSISARGTVWGEAAAPTGNVLAEGGTGISAFSHARSGLPQGTRIFYRGYADNDVGRGYSAEGSFYTEPGQASSVTFSQVGTDAMRVSWTAGANSDGAIVVMREANSTVDDPVDGTLHTANAAYGTPGAARGSSFVVYRGSGTHVDVTNLDPNKTYYVEVFAYKGTVANSGVDQGINYRQTSPATGSQLTLSCATIVTQPDALYERGQGGSVNMTAVANNSNPNYAWRKRGAGWSGGTWSGSTGGNGGTFIGNNQSSIDTSSKAWGMWAEAGTTEMRRDFGAMSVGDVFYIEMDNNGIASGKSVGLGLQNSSGQNMLEFFFGGGDSNYTLNRSGGNHDTGIGWTSAGLEITVEVTSSTTFSMSVKVKGGSTTSLSGTFINSGSISRVRMWNYEAGSGGDLFFNSLRVGPPNATHLYEDTAAAYSSWEGNRGQGPLSNGGRISGADTATLSLTDLEGGDAGFYDVVVWNDCGGAYSESGRGELTVAVPNYGIRDDAGVNLPTLTYWHTGLGADRTEKGGEFNSRNLGEIDGLFIKGANVKTWKTAGGNVTGTKFEYKVWKTTDSEPGSWTERSVSHTSDDNPPDNTEQTWANFGTEIDIFDVHSLDYGTYNVKIRFTVQGTGTPGINESGPFSATFAYVLPDSPDEPGSASATADGPQMVRLAWTKNGAGNNVMIVHRVGSASTAPSDGTGYSVGADCGSGKVIYNGSGTSLEHIVAAGSDNRYAFYSVNGANFYSDGLARSVTTDIYGNGIIEQFAYTNTISLAGGNTGQDWSGAWSVASGSWNIDANSSPAFANFDGYPDRAANRVKLTNPGDNSEGKASRSFSAINSGSVFVAFKMAYNWEGANKWAGLSLMDGGTERAFFGKGYGANWHTFAIGDGASSYFSSQDLRGQQDGADKYYLVVGKYDIANGTLYGKRYGPADEFPETEPSSWDVSQGGLSLGQVNGIRLGGGAGVDSGSVGDCWFDEIRVGTSWGDLLPGVCPTWIGDDERDPAGAVWLGDSVAFQVETFPIGPGQSAKLTMDWSDSTYSDHGMHWWKHEGQNSIWTNYTQMGKSGTHDYYFTVSSSGCGNESTAAAKGSITVSALNPPGNPSATGGQNQIALSWSQNAQGHDVLVLRRTSNDNWPSPAQGTTYHANESVDDATVVYRGGLTGFTDSGLAPNQTYYYRFYSENWSYYSTGTVDASAATDEGDQEITVDGNPNEWFGSPGTVINSGTLTANGEFIWRDKAGEQRTDQPEHANADIREFRVFADTDDVYFLVKLADVTDVIHPHIAIGVDTRRSAASEGMNWLGQFANLFLGSDYYGEGAAPHFPEYNIMVHQSPDGAKVEMFADGGEAWYTPEGCEAAISTEYNAVEVKIPRAALGLTGSTIGRFTVASMLNNPVWANEGDTTRIIAEGTPAAVDSISIAPYQVNDGALGLSAWQEDISDNDIDFWFDVPFGPGGLGGNIVPAAPGNLSPAHDATIAASPTLSWSAPTDSDGFVTSYLLEVSTNPNLNGVNGTENGEILLRVNLPASQTSYALSTSEAEYYWRVRARDNGGALSGGSINRFVIGGKQDTEGPVPTLLYIGTDVQGFLDGDYDDYIERYGYIQSVTDREIRAGNDFGFVLRWEDPSGVYATNQTHAGAPGGAGQFTWNIVAEDGRVSPNWDILEIERNESGEIIRQEEWDVDVPFYADDIEAGSNFDSVITTWAHDAFKIEDYNENIEYYLTVSAEDAYTDGGSWWQYGTWPSFDDGGPFGRMSGGYTADGPNTARNITVNHLIRIQVTDDDETPPAPALGAGWDDARSLNLSDGTDDFAYTGAGLGVVYTLYDGDVFNSPLLMEFNVYDPHYMGLAYGNQSTYTEEGRTLTNTSLNVGTWLANSTAAFNGDKSYIGDDGRDDDTTLAWHWPSLSRDAVTALWGDAELSGDQGVRNRISLNLFDRDNDRPSDQASQTVDFGWIQIKDDDTEPPEVQAFTINDVGMSADGLLPGGGIAIVGVNGNPATGDGGGGGESFSFVVLSPFPEGTRIWFTDCGWANNEVDNQWHRTSEFHLAEWYSEGGAAVGDVITLTIENLNNGGDQVAVYQYVGEGNPKDDPENVRFIYAVQMGKAWDVPPVPDNNESSALYYGLVNEETAVDLYGGTGSAVNWTYVGPRSGTASDLLLQISDRSNWERSATALDMDFEDVFDGGFTVLGPGDLDWDRPTITDAELHQGTYEVAAQVQDITKGLQATGTSWAPAPHFALFNADDELVATKNFSVGFASGTTAPQTMEMASGPAGDYNAIRLGEHVAHLVVSDADNDRVGDNSVVTNTMVVMVVDDDPYPPRVGPARLALELGGQSIAPAPIGEAELLAAWNFNASDYTRDHGFTGEMTTSGLNGTINWYGGSTVNRVGTDEAGVAFSPEYAGNIGGAFQFELDMSEHMALEMSFAVRRTAAGYNHNQVSYSTDGLQFTPFGVPFDPTTSTTLERLVFDFSSVPELNGAPQVFIRITLGVDGVTGSGNNRYDNLQFNAYPLDELVYEITDGQLAEVGAANPLRFGFNVYDPISGVAVGDGISSDIHMAVSVEGLFDEDTDGYDADASVGDTFDPADMSVWTYDSPIPYEDIGTLYGDGETPRPVMATFADMDDDRVDDRSWRIDEVFASLRVIDDDPHPPVVATHRFGGNVSTPLRAFQVATNAASPQVLTSTTDPLVRGPRLTGSSATNTVFVLTDAEMADPEAHGIRFAFGAQDAYSGVARPGSGLDEVMSFSLGNILVNHTAGFQSGMSSDPATNATLTNVWSLSRTWSLEDVTAMVEGGNMRVTVTVPDKDDDRPNDQAILEGHQVGYIRVVDDDIYPPLMGALNLSISSVHNLLVMGFEEYHGWTCGQNFNYVSWNCEIDGEFWVGNDINVPAIAGEMPSQVRVMGMRNQGEENAWLQMPPREDPGTLFAWARLSAANPERIVRLEGRQAPEDEWTSFGDRNVTTADWVLLDWPINETGEWTLRLRRITRGGAPTIYLDDIVLTKRAAWTNAESMEVSFDEAEDMSGVDEYRHVRAAAPDWQSGRNITEGDVVADRTGSAIPLDQGVITGFVFAVDADMDRPGDQLRNPGIPYVVKVDRTPPTGVPGLEASTDVVDDPSTQFDLSWTATDVGADDPGATDVYPAWGSSAPDPKNILSPWRTYKIYYGPYDPLQVEGLTEQQVFISHLADGQYRDNPEWKSVTVDSAIADPSAPGTYAGLANPDTEAIRLYDLDFDQDYMVAIVGVDEAGNEGPLAPTGWTTNNTIRFAVTSGWVVAKSKAIEKFPDKAAAFTKTPESENAIAIGWTAIGYTNLQGQFVTTKEYDLIHWDATRFEECTSNPWDRIETIESHWFVDDGAMMRTRGNMRFYRASYRDRWKREVGGRPQRPMVSEEVYALHNVVLSPGHNYVALHGVPYTNTFAAVFGGTNVFPGGESAMPGSGATVVEFYNPGPNALLREAYYLTTDNRWRSEEGGGDVTDVVQTDEFFNRGFSITLPEELPESYRHTTALDYSGNAEGGGALQLDAMIWSPVLQVPTNGFSQIIQAGRAAVFDPNQAGRVELSPEVLSYNLVALRLPVAAHPGELGLLESGLGKGYKDFADHIYTWNTSTKSPRAGSTIYADTNGIFRYVANNALVPADFFKPNDVIVIVSRNRAPPEKEDPPGSGNWTWRYHPRDFYNLPTRWIEPSTALRMPSANLTFSFVSDVSMRLNWDRGDGQQRVVVARAGSPVSWVPGPFNPAGAHHNFATAADLGGGQKLVYAGPRDEFTLTGLAPMTTYHVAIYDYHLLNGQKVFLPDQALTASQATRSAAPTVPPANLRFKNVQQNQLTFAWDPGGGDGRVVIVRKGHPVQAVLIGGTSYTANSVFGQGFDIGDQSYVVFAGGTANSVTVTGLEPGHTYYFKVIEYNGSGSTLNYGASAKNQCSIIPAPPTTPPGQIVFSDVSPTAMTVSWAPATSGGGDGRLLIVREGFAVSWEPTDGEVPLGIHSHFPLAAELTPFPVNKACYLGPGESVTLTGLTPGTPYHVKLFEYNGTGEARSYHTATAPTASLTLPE